MSFPPRRPPTPPFCGTKYRFYRSWFESQGAFWEGEESRIWSRLQRGAARIERERENISCPACQPHWAAKQGLTMPWGGLYCVCVCVRVCIFGASVYFSVLRASVCAFFVGFPILYKPPNQLSMQRGSNGGQLSWQRVGVAGRGEIWVELCSRLVDSSDSYHFLRW